MRAIVCTKGDGVSCEDAPSIAETPEGHVRLKVLYVGVCGTDFHTIEGKHPTAAERVILGHEISAIVAEEAPGLNLPVGTPVAVNPYIPCNECTPCKTGRPNCCQTLKVLGVHIDGGMSEEILVPIQNVRKAEGVAPEAIPMIEVLAVGQHAVCRANIKHDADPDVLLIGCGPVGLSIALLLRNEGTTPNLIDNSEERVAMAQNYFEFSDAILADGSEATKELLQKSFDFIFDATGCAASVSNAFNNLLAHGGTFVSVGIMTGPLQLDPAEGHRCEKSLVFTRNSTDPDFDKAVAFAQEYPHTVSKFVTQTATLEDAARMMGIWSGNKKGLLKGVIAVS